MQNSLQHGKFAATDALSLGRGNLADSISDCLAATASGTLHLMEVLCAGEDLLRVECGQVSPSLLADLLCSSFSGGGWCFLFGCLFLVCFGCCCLLLFLSPSISHRGFLHFSHISCDSQVIALLVERGARILTHGFTLSLTSYSMYWTASIPRDPSQPASKKRRVALFIRGQILC